MTAGDRFRSHKLFNKIKHFLQSNASYLFHLNGSIVCEWFFSLLFFLIWYGHLTSTATTTKLYTDFDLSINDHDHSN